MFQDSLYGWKHLPFPLSAAVLHLLLIFLDYSITEHFLSCLKAVYTGHGGNPVLWAHTHMESHFLY